MKTKVIAPAVTVSVRSKWTAPAASAWRFKQFARDFCARTELRIASGVNRLARNLRLSSQIVTQVVARFRESSYRQGAAVLAFARKLITLAYNRPSVPRNRGTAEPGFPLPRTASKSAIAATRVDRLLPWASLGIAMVCGIVILVLLLQVRDMRAGTSRWQTEVATLKLRIALLEKTALEMQKATTQARDVPTSAPKQAAYTLSAADEKLLRQFIKGPPVRTDARPRIQVGDEIPGTGVLLPDALVDRVPALRGVRFVLDEDGSIVLIARSSNSVSTILRH